VKFGRYTAPRLLSAGICGGFAAGLDMARLTVSASAEAAGTTRVEPDYTPSQLVAVTGAERPSWQVPAVIVLPS
jgi:hypothetical protein